MHAYAHKLAFKVALVELQAGCLADGTKETYPENVLPSKLDTLPDLFRNAFMKMQIALLIASYLIATAMVSPVQADTATLTYDGFDYLADSDLNGKNGGFGWRNSWTSPHFPDASITSPGLSYTSMLPVIGNAFTEQSIVSVRTATRTLETSLFSTLDNDGNIGVWKDGQGTDIWFSFLAQDNNTLDNPQLIWGGLRLSPNSMGAAMSDDLFVGKFANPGDLQHYWGFGVNADITGHADADPNKSAILPTPIVQGQSYLFVGHVETLETIERISLYVNPTTVDIAPAAPDAQISVGSGEFRFFFADFEVGESNGNFTFDELTFGRDYKSVALTSESGPRVAAVPEPATAVIFGLGTLVLTARRRRSAQA